jgi:hypothetical protein
MIVVSDIHVAGSVIKDSLTPTVLSLVVATAVFTDTVVICGMRIGNLQFVLCVIMLLCAMRFMGIVSVPFDDYNIVVRWNELYDLINLLKVILFDMWEILLFDYNVN